MNIHIIGTRRRVTSLRPKEIENFSRKIALTAAVLAAFSVGCGARIVTNDASSEEQLPVAQPPPPLDLDALEPHGNTTTDIGSVFSKDGGTKTKDATVD